MFMRIPSLGGVSLVTVALAATPAFAQIDLSGEWSVLLHEDEQIRRAGPNAQLPGRHGVEIGDYTGLPINAAARFMADAWDASLQTLKEHQAEPFSAPYNVMGFNLRVSRVIDDDTQRVIAYKLIQFPGTPFPRTIWMDGRSHPPDFAAHSWQGFSTGRWEGDTLRVETTHLKKGYLQLNGVCHSDRAVLTELFIRHGDVLTWISMTTDPVYLTEPLVRTANWVFNPRQQMPPTLATEVVEEIRDRLRGYVPHFLPGRNPWLTEFATRVGVPFEATRGGAGTMYPEYAVTLQSRAAPSPPDRARR